MNNNKLTITTAEVNVNLLAFENIHEPVFYAWLKLSPECRLKSIEDLYVFYSYTFCAESYIKELMRQDLSKANLFVDEIVNNVNYLNAIKIPKRVEWYRGIEKLVNNLINLNYLEQSQYLAKVGIQTGAKKFPDIFQSLTIQSAYLDAISGRKVEAIDAILNLVSRPFLLTGKKDLSGYVYKLIYILASQNLIYQYRLTTWLGSILLHSSSTTRDTFTEQLKKTYRGNFRAIIDTNIPFHYRYLYFLNILSISFSRLFIFRLIGFALIFRWIHFSALYLFSKLFKIDIKILTLLNKNEIILKNIKIPSLINNKNKINKFNFFNFTKKKILVTRAMGGIGDILMMTPGLVALKIKYPNAKIDFAIPNNFHDLMIGISGINVLDIHVDSIDLKSYDRWINLSDCPAGKIEGKQSPNVNKNRTEIFAKSMGISKSRLKNTVGFIPVYKVTSIEANWADNYLKKININKLPIIGVQVFAADSYRNWPFMEELVRKISKNNLVLLFHSEPFSGFEFNNVFKILKPLRESVALSAKCTHLVVPDSSFLHFSASLNIPTIAIFGAISGRLRTKNYSNVSLLAPAKSDYPCYPCWRHEYKPCHLSNGRESLCLRSITVENVLEALDGKAMAHNKSFKESIVSWVKYGAD